MRTENGYQFARVEWSSRAGATKKTMAKNGRMSTRDRSWSAREIADEAERKPGACGHVENPQAPGLLYGVMPHAAVDAAEKWAAGKTSTYEKSLRDGSKKTITRGYRDDAPIIACGVVSLPREREAEWNKFKNDTVGWLQKKYGRRLLSVVEHLDEEHPHLHFYAVPLPGEDFGAVHEGYAARQQARGGDGKTKTAYIDAMKRWQDDFHAGVGSKYNLDRIGPARQRVERDIALIERDKREAANAKKAAEIVIENAQESARLALVSINADREKINAERATIDAEKVEINCVYTQMNADSLALEQQRLEAEQAALKAEQKRAEAEKVAHEAEQRRRTAKAEREALKAEKAMWRKPGAKLSAFVHSVTGADEEIKRIKRVVVAKAKSETQRVQEAAGVMVATAQKTADNALKETQEAKKQLAAVIRQVPIANVLRVLEYEYDVDAQAYSTELGYARETNGSWTVENWTQSRQPRNSIDMIKGLRGINADAAVTLIAGACDENPPPQPIPVKNENNWQHVKQYLIEQRGISETVVTRLEMRRFAYADDYKNAVFLLGDDHAQGAELRGTRGKFHGTRGGEKACFHLPPPPDMTGPKIALIAESAIEAASLQSLYPNTYCIGTGGSNYERARVEMEKMKKAGYKIVTAMNNDAAGRKHAAALRADADIMPPAKDWNDALRAKAAVPPLPFATPAPAPVEAPKPAVKPSALSIFDEYPKLAHLTTEQRRAVLGGIEQVLTDQPAQLALFERIGQIEYLRDVMARMTSERLQSLADIGYERTASISSWSGGLSGPR